MTAGLEKYTDTELRNFAAKPEPRAAMEKAVTGLREIRDQNVATRDNAIESIGRIEANLARLELALNGGVCA